MYLTPNFQELFIFIEYCKEKNDEQFYLLKYDTSLLWWKKEEIKQITKQYLFLINILSHIDRTIKEIQNKWIDIRSQFENKFSLLKQHLLGLFR